MTLAFHEVVTSYGVHVPCLPHLRVSPADSIAAVLGSPQALSKAHIQRGEPISVDSHWRRTHQWLHLHDPGVGWWLKAEAQVEAEQLGGHGV